MHHSEENLAEDRAAQFAEAAFLLLSTETAKIAPACALFHWFDQSIIEALLEQDELTLEQMEVVYQEILTLPFIEAFPWGLSFHTLTREGLLQHALLAQPELVRNVARRAAPVYEANEGDERSLAEAFFCFMIAGETHISFLLQERLFETAVQRRDWQHVEMVLTVQREAESFPSVNPLPRTEQYFLLQGLVYRLQDQQEEAIQAYGHALAMNPKNAVTYVSRGTVYSEQNLFAQALDDYQRALRLDWHLPQAYMGKGIVYSKLTRYQEALRAITHAIRYGLANDITSCYQGNTLRELGRYEEALDAYDESLQRNPEYAEAFLGKGAVHNQLAAYDEALNITEQVLSLYPGLVAAYIIKGQALIGLERLEDALAVFEGAIRLNPNSADAFRGKGHALSRLKQYEEATIAYEQAGQLDPQHQEFIAENAVFDKGRNTEKRKQQTANKSSNIAATRQKETSRSSHFASQRKKKPFWGRIRSSFAALVVVILTLISVAIFGVHHNSRGPDLYPTAIAECAAIPTLTGPVDGQIVHSRTVTLAWEAPQNCLPDGYTVRISAKYDPEAKPWIVDTGWAPTDYTYIFSADGTYYWHIRDCKPCTPFQPGNWAIRSFTIDTSSPSGLSPKILGNTLYTSLEPNQQLVSKNGEYILLMRKDGHLVEYDNGQFLWEFPASGPPGSFLTIQNDGNIVLLRPEGTPIKGLDIQGHENVTLEIQDDGNIVAYENGHIPIKSKKEMI